MNATIIRVSSALMIGCLAFSQPAAWAQKISLGLSAGLPLNPLTACDDGYACRTGRYTFGPSIRAALPHGFSFDAELLYKRFELGFTSDPLHATVHRLEYPLMLRHAVPAMPGGAFVHVGMSFNRVISVNGASVCSNGPYGEEVYCIGNRTAAELRHSHTHGPVAGFGFGFRWGRLQLSPELRVTRWIDRNFGTRDSPVRSNLTALDLLCGLRFQK